MKKIFVLVAGGLLICGLKAEVPGSQELSLEQKADKYHPDWFSGDGTQLCYYANGNEKEYEASLAEMGIEISKILFFK